MVKFAQGILISKDPKMYTKATDIWTNVQSSNLNEELGQIEYIFSDKTGTLTCNVMEFRNLVTPSASYGDRIDDDFVSPSREKINNVNFKDKTLLEDLNGADRQRGDQIKYIFASICRASNHLHHFKPLVRLFFY